MKLDMDLIRKILLWCEEKLPNDDYAPLASEVEIENYSKQQILYHFTLLIEKEYILAGDVGTWQDKDYFLSRLTYDGHQFLESIKNDTLWEKFKVLGKDLGLPVVQASIPVLIKLAAQQLGITV